MENELEFKFGSQMYKTNEYVATVYNQEEKKFYPSVPFSCLRKGDIFAVYLESEQIEHENGSKLFKATTNPYIDELGLACINYTTEKNDVEFK